MNKEIKVEARPETKRKRQPSPSYSAQEKAQAILAVWTEKCRPAEVCRQMRINYMTFLHWQQRGMEGMLQALESRVNLAKGEALSPRLQALLQKQSRAPGADPACQNTVLPGTNTVDDRCQRTSGHYPSGPLGSIDRDSSRPATGPLPPALLRTGTSRPPGDDPGTGTQSSRTPSGTQAESGADETGTTGNAS